ncbi:MAG: D-alanyl-D-alanine carboxypeptidase [Clostridia bacterium]|nr:D-alanyl-D-alanine carboxypeptidase [Clostridia bacterium]
MKKIIASLIVLILLLPSFASRAEGELSLSAKAAYLMTSDGLVLYEKNARKKLPMASTTKIMTCILALESCDLTEKVTFTDKSSGIEGTSLYACAGDTSTVKDLLYAMMLRSANDAASSLAVHIAGSDAEFAKLMNAKCESLDMTDTHFANPHGLPDDEHYTSARDFAHLASYAISNPSFEKIVSTKEYVVTLNGTDKRPVRNHNRLLASYDGAIGVKTGFTKSSGRCLVSAARRDGVTLIAVTLDAPDDWRDHKTMLDYGFEKVESRELIRPREITKTFHAFGDGVIEVENVDGLCANVLRTDEVSFVIEGDRFPTLPVEAGDVIATVTAKVADRVLGQIELRAKYDVDLPKKETVFDKIKNIFG